MAHFIKSDIGAAAVEFALVAFALILLMLGVMDFGRYYWATNAAATATQAGARFAVVNDYAALEMGQIDGIALGYASGAAIPANDVSATECDATGCTNDYTLDSTAYDNIVAAMRTWFPGIDLAGTRVVVRYEHTGLGFAGNPFGTDVVPLVTVRLEDAPFNFVTPGLTVLNPLSLPNHATSLTAEDGES